jgi:DNA polymerase-3 subunit epsilon
MCWASPSTSQLRGESLQNEPLVGELFPELAVPQQPPAKRPIKSLKRRAETDGLRTQTASSDTESLAQQLESHADYRVLRRLQPRLNWPEADCRDNTRSVILLDTETTGLEAARERIIELAMLRVEVDIATGRPRGMVRVYDALEDPGKPIPKEVVALTGIRDSDVKGERLDEEQITQMLDGVDLVIAHNAAFDRPFLENRLPVFAAMPWSCSFADIDWKQQGRSSSKLESLVLALGWFYDAHRAEMDCHALLAVLASDLPYRLNTGSQTGLAQLMVAAATPSYRLLANNAPFDAKDLLKTRGYRWNADQRVWGTRIADDAALQAECAWLRQNVYKDHSAVVQVEKMEARDRFSSRLGKITQQQI